MAADIIPTRPVDWPRRLALATFVVLLTFGLLLLVFPDLANELDERSSGDRLGPLEEVTVTESKRTIERETASTDDSTTQATNRRVPHGVTNRGPGSNNRPQTQEKSSDTERTRDSSTTGEVQTTTTRTVRPTREDGFGSRAFAVPALFVLLRVAAVALIAGAVAALVSALGRRLSRADRQSSPPGTESSDAEAVSTDPKPEEPEREGPPAELPAAEPVTPQRAAQAKVEIIQGIPLLKEIFAARGEPIIDNTLPDMRLQVQLTEEVTKEQALPVSLLVEDSALALATLRTELEQRLRRLSRDAIAQTSPSVDSILRQLVEEGLFESKAVEGFRNLLRLTDRALHGAAIDPAMTAWVRNEGVPLLMSLDLMLPS